jgi:DNA polymerase-3 subunit epsilon
MAIANRAQRNANGVYEATWYDSNGKECINFGKYKGRIVEEIFKNDPSYFSWMMNADFPLSTKKVITEIKLRGFSK